MQEIFFFFFFLPQISPLLGNFMRYIYIYIIRPGGGGDFSLLGNFIIFLIDCRGGGDEEVSSFFFVWPWTRIARNRYT